MNGETRWRRVRFATPLKPEEDAGPLRLQGGEGGHCLSTRPGGNDLAQAERIEMPYPAAPPGPLSLRRWTRRWPLTQSRAGWLTDLALAGFPALVALFPFLFLIAPNHAVRAGLAAAAICLFVAARPARARLKRDESLRIHARFWDRLITAPPGNHEEDAQEQAARLRQALRAALDFVAHGRVAAAQAAALLLIATLALAWHGATPLLALPPAALIAFLLEKQRGVLADRLARARRETSRHEEWLARAMPSLRQLGLGTTLLAALERGGRDCARLRARMNLMQATCGLAPFWLAAAAVALAVGLQPATDNLPALLLLAPGSFIAARLGAQAACLLRARRKTEVVAALPGPAEEADIAPGGMAEIGLEGIGFRHEHAQSPLFQGFSMHLRRSEAVALTGPSGSGKSTLIDILLGLRQPQEGLLVVDGERRSWEALTAYRARVAGVFQDMPPGFSTLRGVIGHNAPQAGEAEILAAATDAGLAETIASLPMGLETLMVEGGFPQSLIRQLLIAQALAQGPALLVLDETFSGLDRAVAETIIAATRRRGIALLFATHRADLAALADRVVRIGPSLERNPGIAG